MNQPVSTRAVYVKILAIQSTAAAAAASRWWHLMPLVWKLNQKNKTQAEQFNIQHKLLLFKYIVRQMFC